MAQNLHTMMKRFVEHTWLFIYMILELANNPSLNQKQYRAQNYSRSRKLQQHWLYNVSVHQLSSRRLLSTPLLSWHSWPQNQNPKRWDNMGQTHQTRWAFLHGPPRQIYEPTPGVPCEDQRKAVQSIVNIIRQHTNSQLELRLNHRLQASPSCPSSCLLEREFRGHFW